VAKALYLDVPNVEGYGHPEIKISCTTSTFDQNGEHKVKWMSRDIQVPLTTLTGT
jgi:hypothetical protein